MVRTISLILASISFIIVIGGAVYEHLAVVPVWSAAVPASLTMFQGPHALAAQNFWIPIHPTTLLLMLAALLFNWKTERRKFILTTIGGYVLVLGITAVYFVPELMSLTQTTFSTNVDIQLTRRANLWESLSLIRLAFLLTLAFVLLLGLSKPGRGALIAD
jgi:hypothetical protein